MIVKLLTVQHLEFLSLKGGCRGSFESTLVKMPHCWKSHSLAHMVIPILMDCWAFSHLKSLFRLKLKHCNAHVIQGNRPNL